MAATPYCDWVTHELANGLSHTWNVRTDFDFTDVGWKDDLVAADKGQSTLAQLQTLVGIALTERGATFRMRYAMQQSGMSYDGKDAIALELEAGTVAVGRLEQKTSFQGEVATSGKTGTDEFGTYYQFGFDGHRGVIGHVDSTFDKYYPNSGSNIVVDNGVDTLNKSANTVAQKLADAGADLSQYDVWMDYSAYNQWAQEAGNILRVPQGSNTGIDYGVSVANLVAGGIAMPIHLVPGTDIGFYTPTSGASAYYNAAGGCRDVHFLRRDFITHACLGPMSPFVIEIPPGVDGTLTNRFLIAHLVAQTNRAPALSAKMRVAK